MNLRHPDLRVSIADLVRGPPQVLIFEDQVLNLETGAGNSRLSSADFLIPDDITFLYNRHHLIVLQQIN